MIEKILRYKSVLKIYILSGKLSHTRMPLAKSLPLNESASRLLIVCPRRWQPTADTSRLLSGRTPTGPTGALDASGKY
jgi:hypothetical protein